MGKVVPIRPKPPSPGEMTAYRMMTKNWSEALKRLLLPRYWERDRK